MNKPHIHKQKIAPKALQYLQIEMNGQERCALGTVVINGVEFGAQSDILDHSDGIVGFELTLPASGKPEVTIEYHPGRIDKEVIEALGLDKKQNKRVTSP